MAGKKKPKLQQEANSEVSYNGGTAVAVLVVLSAALVAVGCIPSSSILMILITSLLSQNWAHSRRERYSNSAEVNSHSEASRCDDKPTTLSAV